MFWLIYVISDINETIASTSRRKKYFIKAISRLRLCCMWIYSLYCVSCRLLTLFTTWFWEPYCKQIKINLNLLPQQEMYHPLQVNLSHLTSPWLRLFFPQNTNHSSRTIRSVLLCALGSFFCFAAGFTGTTCFYKCMYFLWGHIPTV